LTTYSALAHKQGTLMHLRSGKGKIFDQIAFGLLQHANSKNWFLEILHLESFNQDKVWNTYFRNKGVFDRSTKVISSKRYLQFAVGNNVLGLGIRCKQKTVKASNPILHSHSAHTRTHQSLQAHLFITSSRHLKLVAAEYGFDTGLFSKRETAC